MRTSDMARVLFALAFVALGVLCLFSGDFASVWQPVPEHVPGRIYLAMLSGCVMVLTGAGLLSKRTWVPASFIAMMYTSIWLLALHVPRVIAGPLHEINWGGCAEIAILVAGSWVLYAKAASSNTTRHIPILTGPRAVHAACPLFAVSLPLIGLEHIIYERATADMVPSWFPNPMAWAYLTGAAHIAAGFAIMLGVLPRLAAALETWMMGIFTVCVWIPAVIHTPAQRFAWTGLIISTFITAAAWVVSASYHDVPWLSVSRVRQRRADPLMH